jgi:AcrR family transcriptional regulator
MFLFIDTCFYFGDWYSIKYTSLIASLKSNNCYFSFMNHNCDYIYNQENCHIDIVDLLTYRYPLNLTNITKRYGLNMTNASKITLQETHDGVKPAHQLRSRKRRDELINAGIKLLLTKSISQISIIELAATCGYSVGTFYSRFEDKKSFFQALQEASTTLLLDQIHKNFDSEHWKDAPTSAIFRQVVDTTVGILLSDTRGVVKESVIGVSEDPNSWLPIKECGDLISSKLLEMLEGRFLKNDPQRSRDSILFALQMFYGTLVQAVVNDPGPIKIDDPKFCDNLTRMMMVYSELEPN